jgi:hypothetical protein
MFIPNKIVVSLTTIPSREKHILKTIESIQNNTIKPHIIYINMRKYITRLNAEFNAGFRKILLDLNINSPIQIIINESEDYGSLTKIIPIITAETDPDALVIIIDDDIIYSKIFIEGLLIGFTEFNEKEDCAACYSAFLYPEAALELTNLLQCIMVNIHGEQCDIIESGFGLIFKKKWLDKFPKIPIEKENITEEEKNLYICDDYILSLYFDLINIKKKVILYPFIGRYNIDDWSTICNFIEEASNSDDSLSKRIPSIVKYYFATNIVKEFLSSVKY